MQKEQNKRTILYSAYEEDVVTSSNQNYEVPDGYDWRRAGLGRRILDTIVYTIALIFTAIYCPLILHLRVKNRKCLRPFRKQGYFLYGNHTQMIGDAFMPAWACLGKRIYVVVSPANLGIPVLGRILPSLGALPIPSDMRRMKEFNRSIDEKIAAGKCVGVYREAHVWPYYTGIRPYADTAFHYPVRCHVPTFAVTTTYQKRRFGRRPRITMYLDGPFYPREGATPKQQRTQLHSMVSASMEKYSRYSNYEYFHYRKSEGTV